MVPTFRNHSERAKAQMAGTEFACLTYHIIGPWRTPYAVGVEQFRSHLCYLNAAGYTAEGFRELEVRLRSGTGIPERYVVLTIDDGHESCRVAADLLQQYGCQATFFLTRDLSLGRPAYLRNPEIRILRKDGFSIGTHGTTHRGLTFLSDQDCAAELTQSKEWLEDLLGEEIRYMAAPGGFINRRVTKMAGDLGYVLTGTCKEWMNAPAAMPLPGVVNRINIRQDYARKTFENIVSGQKAFYILRRARGAAFTIPKHAEYIWCHR